MIAAYADIAPVSRGLSGQIQSRTYTYTGLAQIVESLRPILAKHGLAVFQEAKQKRDEQSGQLFVGCTTEILHVSGESRASEFLLCCPNETAQAMGSLITYAKRYSYPFAVQSDEGADDDDPGDDDGAAGQPRSGHNRSPAPPKIGPTEAQIRRYRTILAKAVGSDPGQQEQANSDIKKIVGKSIKYANRGEYEKFCDLAEGYPDSLGMNQDPGDES
jgi:hypothetical protein